MCCCSRSRGGWICDRFDTRDEVSLTHIRVRTSRRVAPLFTDDHNTRTLDFAARFSISAGRTPRYAFSLDARALVRAGPIPNLCYNAGGSVAVGTGRI